MLIPLPNKKDKIWFSDKKEPYWNRTEFMKQFKKIFFEYIPSITKHYQSRTEYDTDGVLVGLNEEDTNYIINTFIEEIRRRREGIYFQNGHETVYLTGDHYFVLVWGAMPRHDKGIDGYSGEKYYADYREFQRDFFYIIKHCHDNHKRIAGAIISKAKKTGITNCFWLYYLNRATINFDTNYGAMNIGQDVCAKTFRDYFLFALNKLPPIFRPDVKQKSEADGTIIFGKQFRNTKKAKLAINESEDDLNSSIFCVPTKDKAFDVAVMAEIFFDEPTKYKQSFGEIWRTNKESIKIQSKINGKAWIFNYTTGEDTDSFREAREIFKDSALSTSVNDPYGQTKSGLIKWHIPAFKSWEGAFDKYGRCDEKKAVREIQYERDRAKGNKRALQAIIRQYANDEREAWGSAGMGSVFDNIRLGKLEGDLDDKIKLSPVDLWIEGYLRWENQMWNLGLKNKRRQGEFCKVKFVPLTQSEKEEGVKGDIRIYGGMLSEAHQNIALKQGRDDMGNLLPPDEFIYALGGDPTNYAAGSEVIEGSKNSSHVFSFPNPILDSQLRYAATNRLKIEYFDRPELPDEAFEMYLKLIIWTGAISIVEANAPYVATKLMQEGLGYYMIVKNKETGAMCQWQPYLGLPDQPDKKYQLIKSSANQSDKPILEAIIRVLKDYIHEPMDGEFDYGATIEDIEWLRQMMGFDAEDTKIYDKVMSAGYGLLAIEVWRNLLMKDNDMYSDPDNIRAVMNALDFAG